MDDLIKALQIFRKYADQDPYAPTHCEHDQMWVYPGYDRDRVSAEDVAILDDLGWLPDEGESDDGWVSFRYGSC